MRKTIVYIVILGILGFGVWYFLFNDKGVFSVDEAGFNVKNTTDIYRIFLADKKGDTVSLKRTDTGWVVNGSYKVRPDMIALFMETLTQQEAQYPVPENAHNPVITTMAGTAIKVELYNKEGEAMRKFYVGGQALNNAGTYMLMEGAERPYVVQLPLYKGYVTPRYSVNVKDWRDRTVFDLAPEEIQEVAVTYPNEELNNFTMKRNDAGEFIIETHPALMQGKELNKRRVKVFAGFFEGVAAEGFLDGVTDLDSIIANADKRLAISVTAKNGGMQHVDIYWRPVNKRSKNLSTSDPDIPDEYDSDRYYAVMNNYRDTVVIQRWSFDKLFRKGYEFYEKDEE